MNTPSDHGRFNTNAITDCADGDAERAKRAPPPSREHAGEHQAQRGHQDEDDDEGDDGDRDGDDEAEAQHL